VDSSGHRLLLLARTRSSVSRLGLRRRASKPLFAASGDARSAVVSGAPPIGPVRCPRIACNQPESCRPTPGRRRGSWRECPLRPGLGRSGRFLAGYKRNGTSDPPTSRPRPRFPGPVHPHWPLELFCPSLVSHQAPSSPPFRATAAARGHARRQAAARPLAGQSGRPRSAGLPPPPPIRARPPPPPVVLLPAPPLPNPVRRARAARPAP